MLYHATRTVGQGEPNAESAERLRLRSQSMARPTTPPMMSDATTISIRINSPPFGNHVVSARRETGAAGERLERTERRLG